MRIRSFADKDQDGIVFTAVLDADGHGVFVSAGLAIETVADTNGLFRSRWNRSGAWRTFSLPALRRTNIVGDSIDTFMCITS